MPKPLVLIPLLIALTHPAAEGDELSKDQEAIRKAIPEASAMNRTDFEKWAQGTTLPSLESIQDRSLTAHLFTTRFAGNESDAQKRDFRFLGDQPQKPAELAIEVARYRQFFGKRVPSGPITFLHEDRITDFSCKVVGDEASGHVDFEAPKRFAGRAEFTASRSKGQWRVNSFTMPARGLRVIRDNTGVWKRARIPDSE